MALPTPRELPALLSNGWRISCAAQRRQRYAQRQPSYAARWQVATAGTTLGCVSCMRLLGGILERIECIEPQLADGMEAPELIERKRRWMAIGGRTELPVAGEESLAMRRVR